MRPARARMGNTAEARGAGTFPVFDEAGSPRSGRRFAMNEMPARRESRPAPFARTARFGAHLDPAALRRFGLKTTLDHGAAGCATNA